MTIQISSAEPHKLISYADTAERINSHLNTEAMRLSAALQRFSATCTERNTGIGPSRADNLRQYVQQNAMPDAWVRQVGYRFRDADKLGGGQGLVVNLGGIGVSPRGIQEGFADNIRGAQKWIMEDSPRLAERASNMTQFSEDGLNLLRSIKWRNSLSTSMLQARYSSLGEYLAAGKQAGKSYFKNEKVPGKLGLLTIGLDIYVAGHENWEKYKNSEGDLRIERAFAGTVVDSTLSVGLSFGGTVLGASLGGAIGTAIGGPAGTVIGARIGGILGGMAGQWGADWLKQNTSVDDWTVNKIADGLDKGVDFTKEEAPIVGRALGSVAGKLSRLF